MKTQVALVDDHVAIRQMLRVVLEREGEYEICGEAGTGLEAMAMLRRTRPRVVVLDLMLPECSGVEVMRMMREEKLETRVLLFSGTLSRDLMMEGLRAEPHGFVHKDEVLSVLREAMRLVADGGVYFTRMAAAIRDEVRAMDAGWDALSPRERAVLQMIAEGHGNKQMADKLKVAPKTVEHYRAHVMEKLGLHDVAALTRCAVRRGLVSA